MTLQFYWTYLETQKGPNNWYDQSFLVWYLLLHRNGGWNSGQKPATIVTDAFESWQNFVVLFRFWRKLLPYFQQSMTKIVTFWFMPNRRCISWPFSRDSFSLWTWARIKTRLAQPTSMGVPIYFWYTILLLYMFVYHIFMSCPLWSAVGSQSFW